VTRRLDLLIAQEHAGLHAPRGRVGSCGAAEVSSSELPGSALGARGWLDSHSLFQTKSIQTVRPKAFGALPCLPHAGSMKILQGFCRAADPNVPRAGKFKWGYCPKKLDLKGQAFQLCKITGRDLKEGG